MILEQRNSAQELEHAQRCKNLKGEESSLKGSTSRNQTYRFSKLQVLKETSVSFSLGRTQVILAFLTFKIHHLSHSFLGSASKYGF